MANADFSPFFTQNTHPPRYTPGDFASVYLGADNNPYLAITLTTKKSNVMTAVTAALTVLQGAYTISEGDITIATNSIQSSLNSEIANTYSVNKSDVLTQVETDYDAAITAEKDTPCPKCRIGGVGVGRHPSDGPGGASPIDVPCDMCAEFGNVTSGEANGVTVTYTTAVIEYTS